MAPRARILVVCAIVLLIVSVPAARSAPVDEATARTAGAHFLRGIEANATLTSPPSSIRSAERTLAYLFRAEPRGYVVVAADDLLPPIPAYSLEAEAPDALPVVDPLSRLLAADLQSRWDARALIAPEVAASRTADWAALRSGLNDSRRDLRFLQWPPAGSTPTGGWLLSNWTQNAPYNNLCPLDVAHGGTRSVAGCPAVAMAMILNYHGTVQNTTFGTADRYWHAYAGNYYWIPDAYATYGFPDFPVLNGYLATLTSHWGTGTPLTNTDKAALVFACGTAATQVYSASGSGTFGVDQAFDAYQRFAFTGSRLVFDTDPNIYTDLALNMQNARPAHLAVVDPGWTMGHNVVVDGYNTDYYFHLNFGWGGAYNGWYLLPSEIPYGLTVIEGLVLDIIPTSTAAPGATAIAAAGSLRCVPNPATGPVVLEFLSPAGPPSPLSIYDAAGRLVREIAGEGREIRWATDDADGRPVAAGVYFARAGNERVGTRIVICR